MNSACPNCGPSSIELESSGMQEFYICKECGTVLDNVNAFASDEFDSESRIVFTKDNGDQQSASEIQASASVARFLKRTKEQDSLGKLHGIKKTKQFCEVLKLPRHLCEQALTLFKAAYRNEGKIFKRTKEKTSLSAACAYIIARQQDSALTLRAMSEMAEVDLSILGRNVKFVVSVLNITLPPLSMKELMTKLLSNSGLDKSVIDMTEELLLLSNSALITEGRRPETCIIPAAYLSWLSSGLCDSITTPYKKFCSRYNFKFTVVQRQTVKMIRNMLTAMAKHIPWIISCDEKTLISELPAIVRHQVSLQRKAKETVGHSEIKHLRPVANKKPRTSEEDICLQTASSAASSYKHLNSATLHPAEFDEEMDQYICTTEEVKIFQDIKFSYDSHKNCA